MWNWSLPELCSLWIISTVTFPSSTGNTLLSVAVWKDEPRSRLPSAPPSGFYHSARIQQLTHQKKKNLKWKESHWSSLMFKDKMDVLVLMALWWRRSDLFLVLPVWGDVTGLCSSVRIWCVLQGPGGERSSSGEPSVLSSQVTLNDPEIGQPRLPQEEYSTTPHVFVRVLTPNHNYSVQYSDLSISVDFTPSFPCDLESVLVQIL